MEECLTLQASWVLVLFEVDNWILTDLTGTRFPSAGFLDLAQQFSSTDASGNSWRFMKTYFQLLDMQCLCSLRATNGIQTAPGLPGAPKIAEQRKYIIAQCFDSRRPTTFLRCTLTLISCLGLDQSIKWNYGDVRKVNHVYYMSAWGWESMRLPPTRHCTPCSEKAQSWRTAA